MLLSFLIGLGLGTVLVNFVQGNQQAAQDPTISLAGQQLMLPKRAPQFKHAAMPRRFLSRVAAVPSSDDPAINVMKRRDAAAALAAALAAAVMPAGAKISEKNYNTIKNAEKQATWGLENSKISNGRRDIYDLKAPVVGERPQGNQREGVKINDNTGGASFYKPGDPKMGNIDTKYDLLKNNFKQEALK
jgi:hypothetical protein